MDKKFLFENDKVWHALGVMALPAIASQLITLIYNVADTCFVGRTNNPYMVAACQESSGRRQLPTCLQSLFLT